jgi:hypothetical protein
MRETAAEMDTRSRNSKQFDKNLGYSSTYSKSFYNPRKTQGGIGRPLTASLDMANRRKSKRYRGKKGVSIGKSLRPMNRKSKQTPGPGSYNLREKFSSGRAVAWKPRKKYLKLEDLVVTPGPAAYKVKSTIPQMQDYEKKRMEDMGMKIGY